VYGTSGSFAAQTVDTGVIAAKARVVSATVGRWSQ
jgi:hypothetical protein